MLRRWYTGLGAALLLVAGLQAPFAHVHPDDPDHHHAQGFAHAHLATERGHHDHGHDVDDHLEWRAPDDDEAVVYLDWAPTAAPSVDVAQSSIPVDRTWTPTLVRLNPVNEPDPQSHSPPTLRLLPPRSPPL